MPKGFIVFAAAVLFSSCSTLHSKESDSKLVDGRDGCVTGTIVVIGNEPFTKLAVDADSTCSGAHETSFEKNSILIIVADSSTASLMMKNQGRIVRIYFDSIDTTFHELSIHLTKVEFVNQ